MRIVFALQACHSEDWVLDSQEIWAHWYYIWVVALRKLNCVGFCGVFLLVGFDFFQIYHKVVKLIKSKLRPTRVFLMRNVMCFLLVPVVRQEQQTKL